MLFIVVHSYSKTEWLNTFSAAQFACIRNQARISWSSNSVSHKMSARLQQPQGSAGRTLSLTPTLYGHWAKGLNSLLNVANRAS
jgi:hypothetical protein